MESVALKRSDHPTMLYRYPGKYFLHGDYYDYIIVAAKDVDAKLKDGWHRTTRQAKSAKKRRRKLSDLSAAELKAIGKSDKSTAQLSREYNLSKYMINKIKEG